MAYSITKFLYISEYNLCFTIISSSRSLNINIIQFLKLSYPKKIYFILRLVIVIPFSQYLVIYNLNYFNAYPIKNIPIYIIVSPTKFSYKLLVLSLNNIYIKYPLSPIHDLLYYLIISNLFFNIPILLSLLLKASILPSI